MTVIDLPEFFVIEVLNEEVEHLFVLLIHISDGLIFFYFFFLDSFIDQVKLVLLFWDELFIPGDEEVVAIEIGTANEGCDGVLTFFGEDQAIDKFIEEVFLTSDFKPSRDLHVRNADEFADIGGMEAGVPGDDDIALNVLPLGFYVQVVEDCAVDLAFFKDVVLIDDLFKQRGTPMILADFQIMILLLTLS